MGIRNGRRQAVSLLVWWALVTLVLVLAGAVTGQPVTLLGCATSALFLVAVGEAGHGLRQWLRRRIGRAR
ncbi:hypothetical protein [Streptomyces sp. NPDC089795]|uniref:hypothetical protein n=1 Tax=Streptomyces sp. NPDC089795 TaxID=3155297 RepID=UPI0034329F7C